MSSIARVMRRTAFRRAGVPKNMCSVRTSPTPSAPLARAAVASSGESALASTPSAFLSSAQPSTRARFPEDAEGGSPRRTRLRITNPASPSMDTTSPSLISSVEETPSAPTTSNVARLASSSTDIVSHPTTQGLPQPRATTAA